MKLAGSMRRKETADNQACRRAARRPAPVTQGAGAGLLGGMNDDQGLGM